MSSNSQNEVSLRIKKKQKKRQTFDDNIGIYLDMLLTYRQSLALMTVVCGLEI